MRNLIFALAAAAGAAFSVSSWWGVRRLQQKHTRLAVAEAPHSAPDGPQRVAVVLNPVKLNADRAKELIQRACHSAGWDDPLFLETTVEDPGHSQARAALEYGADVVLVGGGDGTVRVAAQTLAGKDVAMGLVPLGTGNLLARNLHLDVTDLYGNIRTALFGQQRRIDTARMLVENARSGESAEHTFLVIAGMGMDAEVIGDTNDELKKAVGWLAYTEAGVRHMPGRRKRVGVALDDEPEQQRKVRSVLFANCGLVPGGIDFVPGSMIDDGVLDIVVMSPRSAIGWVAMGLKILFQHRGGLPVLDYYTARKVVMSSADPLQTQIDGDPSGLATRVTVEVEPSSLLVRVPPAG
ncbi:diacylglycerol kinase family lipid kinase [Paenarthrobacter sp. DKR-5]|uniref:diacylglycerol/lipid kinase family protein n=1 Tax=Paenarthrobacter sp. DKR-5 TaxID=2835535 RepID=UPI001BDBD909|nr:diacylglycerol kinase family protein [Paenarthrobacter sp. DKR-5]MBT1003267.1 diacylglycerol kinase family lipid kinase [Paenarthrobacter sp. DKR-5]